MDCAYKDCDKEFHKGDNIVVVIKGRYNNHNLLCGMVDAYDTKYYHRKCYKKEIR